MTRAVAKYIRMSPRKLRRVVNIIRGKDVNSARAILRFSPYVAGKVVMKVLNSAIANAKENEKLNADELRITKAYVDQGVTLRRWRPMSRGRAYPILKKSSHITIEVLPDIGLKKEKESFKPQRKQEEKKIEVKQAEQKVKIKEEAKEEKEIRGKSISKTKEKKKVKLKKKEKKEE